MIPRHIHQIWLGARPIPAVWMDSWRNLNPDFGYQLWGETAIEEFGLRNKALYTRYLEEGILDGAADVARVEILHRLGGVYADADSLAVRSMDGADFLDADFFAVAEPSGNQPGLISNAFTGGAPGHPVLGRYVEAIASVADFRPMWRLTGPGALTDVLRSQEQDGIVILPDWAFFATTLDGDEVSGGDPYARHFWSTTAERWGRRGGTPYPESSSG